MKNWGDNVWLDFLKLLYDFSRVDRPQFWGCFLLFWSVVLAAIWFILMLGIHVLS